MTRTLADACQCYTRARVVAVRIASRPDRRRLMEMGLVPETILEFIRFSPWSANVAVFRLRHYTLALRHELMNQIDVDLLP